MIEIYQTHTHTHTHIHIHTDRIHTHTHTHTQMNDIIKTDQNQNRPKEGFTQDGELLCFRIHRGL